MATRSQRCKAQLALWVPPFVPPPPLAIAAVAWPPLSPATLAIGTAKQLRELCQLATAATWPDPVIPRAAGNSRVEALYLYVVETARSIQESSLSFSPRPLNTDPGGLHAHARQRSDDAALVH